jgi:hypothetical protein
MVIREGKQLIHVKAKCKLNTFYFVYNYLGMVSKIKTKTIQSAVLFRKVIMER